jgi:lipid-binding SYLF domain-containing protein
MDAKRIATAIACMAFFFPALNPAAVAQEPAAEVIEHDQTPSKNVQATIETFLDNYSDIETFIEKSAGFAVFPKVGKAAFLVGGAHGDGELIVLGMAVGKTTISEISVGLQAGGQTFSEIIFFESEADVERFISGDLEFSSGFSAVAVSGGAIDKPPYREGVVVFTHVAGGLMAEMSVGGQKFKYEPY